eukprot:scaffold90127_cov63-Phaeocystis_antarctica.AAC.14
MPDQPSYEAKPPCLSKKFLRVRLPSLASFMSCSLVASHLRRVRRPSRCSAISSAALHVPSCGSALSLLSPSGRGGFSGLRCAPRGRFCADAAAASASSAAAQGAPASWPKGC